MGGVSGKRLHQDGGGSGGAQHMRRWEAQAACYTALGLTPGATLAEVKRAYRRLVKRWHPDVWASTPERPPQDLERFYAITSAYATLRAVAERTPPPGRRRQGAGFWPGLSTVCLAVGVLITLGLYGFLGTASPPALPFFSASRGALTAQSPSQAEYITLGSTQDAVLAIQGKPTWATERMWDYRGSRLYFTAGRVTGWEIWPAAPLQVQLLPAVALTPVPAFFTVGSTKDEVLAVQGTPTKVTERLWEYGMSRVMFADNRVTRWEVWPGAPLRARRSPGEPAP